MCVCNECVYIHIYMCIYKQIISLFTFGLPSHQPLFLTLNIPRCLMLAILPHARCPSYLIFRWSLRTSDALNGMCKNMQLRFYPAELFTKSSSLHPRRRAPHEGSYGSMATAKLRCWRPSVVAAVLSRVEQFQRIVTL